MLTASTGVARIVVVAVVAVAAGLAVEAGTQESQ